MLLKPIEQLSNVEHLNSALGRMNRVVAPLQRDITQAGLTMTVGTLLLSAGCLSLLAYLVVKLLTFSTLLALGASVIAAFIPFIYVKQMKSRRLRKFEEQFPEAIDLIGRALRAGHAFTTGLVMVAEEIPKPVGEEFKLLYDRQNFGMPVPEAMKQFAERIPLIDARFFVTAVLTQRETGGNLGKSSTTWRRSSAIAFVSSARCAISPRMDGSLDGFSQACRRLSRRRCS